MASSFIDVSPKVARKQKMAEILLNNSTKNEPIYGWGQGLAKALAIGSAGYLGKQANDEEDTERKQNTKDLSTAISSSAWVNPDKPDQSPNSRLAELLQSTGNDNLSSSALQLAMKGSEDEYGRGSDLLKAKGAFDQKKSLIDYKHQVENGSPTLAPGGNGQVPPNLTGDPTIDKKLKENYGKDLGKQAAAAPGQATAKTNLDNIFLKMSARFNELDKKGGTPGHGVLSYLSNTEGVDLPFGLQTPGGQDIARMRGTPEQAIREQLRGDIGDVKTEYQKASGLTSKQLDSNQEAKQFLASLPNLLNQNTSNQARIADMSERFANSIAKAKIESQGQAVEPESGATSQNQASPEDMNRLKANPAEKDLYDQIYGPGAADKVLGGQPDNALPIDGEQPVLPSPMPMAPVGGPVPSAAGQRSLNNQPPALQSEVVANLYKQMKAAGRSDEQIVAYLKSKGLS